jgi:hypothetical protein
MDGQIPPHLSHCMSFTNQKLPKGKEYWGVKDRLKETEGDTHTERGGGEENRHKDTDSRRWKGRKGKRTSPEKKIAQINWRAMMSIAKLLGHNWFWNMAAHVWHVKDIINIF